MQDQSNSLENMLLDVVIELRNMGVSAREVVEKTGDGFDKGRQFAIYEVLSLLANQADAFGVDRTRVGLDGFSPEDIII